MAIAAVAIALIATVGGACTSSDDAGAVTLEPTSSDGPDPFTGSVALSDVAEFPETVTAVTAELTSSLDTDSATGTLVATGTTPGLYGGTKDNSACDPIALGEFLAENEDKATAWAGVFDIDVDEIPDYLAGLTPVVLTVDTLVTNHGFSGGKATPRQSVLQAGTAVMVDDQGIPRVRCSCGNPLGPPAQTELENAEVSGDEWSGYEPGAVAAVRAGDTVASFTLTDVVTGAAFEQPVGTSIGSTWIAVSGTSTYDRSTPSGTIYTSPDGVTWNASLRTTPMRGVATSDSLAVVVGNDAAGGGSIHTSTDGATWSEPIAVTDALNAVAHGGDRWIAVGDRSFAEEGGEGDGSGGAIYTSPDGTTWERVATTSPYDNASLVQQDTSAFLNQTMLSVGYGGDLWVATARECSADVCQVVEFTSPDGTTWTRKSFEGTIASVAVANDGTRWGFVGAEVATSGENPAGVAGTSTDGTTWSFGPTEPDGVALEGLSAAGGGGWLAVADTALSVNPVPESDGVYRSADLQTWEKLSSIDEDLHGVALFAVSFVAPETPAPATTTTVAPIAPTTSSKGVQILTRGLQFVDADGIYTEMALYADPASAAIAQLTAMLGAPQTSFEAGDGTCTADSTVSKWGALRIVSPGKDAAAVDWTVVLTGTAAELPAAPVFVAGDFTLGTTSEELASYYPGVPKSSDSFEGSTYDSFLLDPSGGEGDPGVLVFAKDGVTESITAPSYLQDNC